MIRLAEADWEGQGGRSAGRIRRQEIRRLMRKRGRASRAAGWAVMLVIASAPLALGSVTAGPAVPALAASAPPVTYGHYMDATTASGLNTEAYNAGYSFAQGMPSGATDYLILDFGCVWHSGSTYGAEDFSGVAFQNSQILTALENASDGVHAGYKTGAIIITYGNNNSCPTSYANYKLAGTYQELRASNLASFESSNGRVDQGVAAASDMEPAWDTFADTSGLVDGANSSGYGYLYLDYGSADGCPESGTGGDCYTGWDVHDVGYVSYEGEAVPAPEIYSSALADQWTVIRKNWGNGYTFWAVLGSPAGSAQSQWNDLNSLNSGLVGSDLIVVDYG